MRSVFLSMLLLASACEAPQAIKGTEGPQVTLAQYNQIKEGMTYEEVKAILGSDGVEQSSNNIAGIKTVMYAWNGNTLGGNMNAMFQNGKLIQKAQFGLE